MMLILVVSISGVYEWAITDETLGAELGVGAIEGFESATLRGDLESLSIDSNHLVSTITLTEFHNPLTSLMSFFGSVWSIFMKLMFGWLGLIYAVLASMGMETLAVVFIPPLAVLQIIAALYFLRDIVNTVRGVG